MTTSPWSDSPTLASQKTHLALGRSVSKRQDMTEGVSPSIEKRWYSVYCRSRHEKSVHQELERRNIRSFLPLREITRFWSDRRKTIQEPLFRGYVFVNIEPECSHRVYEASGIVGFVGGRAGEPWEIPEADIAALQRFVVEEIAIDPYPYLQEGRRVRVRRGPLSGVEGFVVQKRGVTRLVISVEMMMQSVAVEINPALVEPIN